MLLAAVEGQRQYMFVYHERSPECQTAAEKERHQRMVGASLLRSDTCRSRQCPLRNDLLRDTSWSGPRFTRCRWRTTNRKHAALVESFSVSKFDCVCPEFTGEVFPADLRKISRSSCRGYGQFVRRSLILSSPAVSLQVAPIPSEFFPFIVTHGESV
jgi:hypothetical protein